MGVKFPSIRTLYIRISFCTGVDIMMHYQLLIIIIIIIQVPTLFFLNIFQDCIQPFGHNRDALPSETAWHNCSVSHPQPAS